MHAVHISKITVSANRQRQEFDPEAMQELKNSIEDNGLFHPIVLRQEGESLVLVAGERRLRAIKEIFELGGQVRCDGLTFRDGQIPFVSLGELSPLAAEEAELDENFRRRDLTWQEHAAAVARLHALRERQFKNNRILAEAAGTLPDEKRGLTHTVADTAEELTGRRDGSYQDQIRKELIVARHLDKPEIAKAKDVNEAFKILKKVETQQRNADLARSVGSSLSAGSHTLLNMNCLEWMARPESVGRFDVILTDPPYGMGADTFGDSGGRLVTQTHAYDDSYESWKVLMQEWCRLSAVVTKPQAHAYVFCDIDRFHELKSMMETAGWYVFRTPMVNVKTNSGRVPLPDRGPRRQYEILLYAIKGNKTVNHIFPDVITVSGDENLNHGAQKPVALYQNLLQRSVKPGDEVLDAFAGTGPILPAGHSLKCRVTAIEQAPDHFGTMLKRLEQLEAGDSLGIELNV